MWSKLFTYIDKATASGRNVLIHSLAGVHRAGMCAAAYLMHANELDMMKAIRILQEARPVMKYTENHNYSAGSS